MAGLYGEVDSRVDYRRILNDATIMVRHFLKETPNYAEMQGIAKQLDAMKRWTESGREPSDNERRSINVGLIAVREFDGATGELDELSQKLFALNNHFEDWPTDAEATSDTDDGDDE